MKFKCSCNTHILEVIYNKGTKKFDFADVRLIIYDIYNQKTGRKYKKPKLIGDVVLMNGGGQKQGKELTRFLKFIAEIFKNKKRRQ